MASQSAEGRTDTLEGRRIQEAGSGSGRGGLCLPRVGPDHAKSATTIMVDGREFCQRGIEHGIRNSSNVFSNPENDLLMHASEAKSPQHHRPAVAVVERDASRPSGGSAERCSSTRPFVSDVVYVDPQTHSRGEIADRPKTQQSFETVIGCFFSHPMSPSNRPCCLSVSICVSVRVSVCVCRCICVPICLSVCMAVCLSVC